MSVSLPYSLADVKTYGRHIRVHGNGFIQLNMPNNDRIHLFGHPDIPKQIQPTPIHDHVFGFESLICSGMMQNIWYTLNETQDKPHTHFVCGFTPTPADKDTFLEPSDVTGFLEKDCQWFGRTGESYHMEPGDLHETIPHGIVVTWMHKTKVIDYKPRVLCPIGCIPDNRFSRFDFSEKQLWDILLDVLSQ